MRIVSTLALILTISAANFSSSANAQGGPNPASSVPDAQSGVPPTQSLSSLNAPPGTQTVSSKTTVTPVKITIMRRVKNRYPVFYRIGDNKAFQAPVGTDLEVRKITDDGKLDVVVIKVGDNTNNEITAPLVEKDYEYLVDPMSPRDIIQDSLITGLLVVPFKYHFSDRSISTTNTTVGYYFGWEYDTPSLGEISLPTKTDVILSVGVSPISVQAQAGAQSGETNLLGLTFAGGLGFGVAEQVKALLVCGKDWARGYIYNAKTWCMAGIGYAFY